MKSDTCRVDQGMHAKYPRCCCDGQAAWCHSKWRPESTSANINSRKDVAVSQPFCFIVVTSATVTWQKKNCYINLAFSNQPMCDLGYIFGMKIVTLSNFHSPMCWNDWDFQKIYKKGIIFLQWTIWDLLIYIAFIFQFSFDDLKSSPDQTACWDGVRNYQVSTTHHSMLAKQ